MVTNWDPEVGLTGSSPVSKKPVSLWHKATKCAFVTSCFVYLCFVPCYESGSPVSPCSAVSFYQIMPTVRIRTRLVTKNFLNIQKKEVLVILPNNTSKTNNLLISDRLFKITIAGFMQPVSCKFTTMPECQESGYSDHPCHCESDLDIRTLFPHLIFPPLPTPFFLPVHLLSGVLLIGFLQLISGFLWMTSLRFKKWSREEEDFQIKRSITNW